MHIFIQNMSTPDVITLNGRYISNLSSLVYDQLLCNLTELDLIGSRFEFFIKKAIQQTITMLSFDDALIGL